MNFIKKCLSYIKSPKFEECFLKRKTFKSFVYVLYLKKKRFEERFVLQNQIKKNSTHH